MGYVCLITGGSKFKKKRSKKNVFLPNFNMTAQYGDLRMLE